MMNVQEVMTCTQYNLPVINIILNNNYLGMVRQWQTFFMKIDCLKLSLKYNQISKCFVNQWVELGIELLQRGV